MQPAAVINSKIIRLARVNTVTPFVQQHISRTCRGRESTTSTWILLHDVLPSCADANSSSSLPPDAPSSVTHNRSSHNPRLHKARTEGQSHRHRMQSRPTEASSSKRKKGRQGSYRDRAHVLLCQNKDRITPSCVSRAERTRAGGGTSVPL